MFRGRGMRVASRLGRAAAMLLLGVTGACAAPPWHVNPDSVGTLEGHLRWEGRAPVASSPEQRARVGKPCEVHPKQRLKLDVVPIHHGIVGFLPSGGDPRTQFPNAHVVASFGCVVGFERWAEVASCPDCRLAFYWHNPRYLLQPIRPLAVTSVER